MSEIGWKVLERQKDGTLVSANEKIRNVPGLRTVYTPEQDVFPPVGALFVFGSDVPGNGNVRCSALAWARRGQVVYRVEYDRAPWQPSYVPGDGYLTRQMAEDFWRPYLEGESYILTWYDGGMSPPPHTIYASRVKLLELEPGWGAKNP